MTRRTIIHELIQSLEDYNAKRLNKIHFEDWLGEILIGVLYEAIVRERKFDKQTASKLESLIKSERVKKAYPDIELYFEIKDIETLAISGSRIFREILLGHYTKKSDESEERYAIGMFIRGLKLYGSSTIKALKATAKWYGLSEKTIRDAYEGACIIPEIDMKDERRVRNFILDEVMRVFCEGPKTPFPSTLPFKETHKAYEALREAAFEHSDRENKRIAAKKTKNTNKKQ